MRKAQILLLAAMTILVWVLSKYSSIPVHPVMNFHGWPAQFDQKPLHPLGLTTNELIFQKDFPGQLARFSDGQREIVIRWVAEPTRLLHPAQDCFVGSGYQITPLPLNTVNSSRPMSCFAAKKDSQQLKVCEFVTDQQSGHWPDISSWYWSAVFQSSKQGWYSYVIAENLSLNHQD